MLDRKQPLQYGVESRVIVALFAASVAPLAALATPLSLTFRTNCVAWVALTFGVWVFWVHGGRWITAAGVYALASTAFVGYAGLWWVERLGPDLDQGIFVATATAHFAQCVMFAIFWASSDSGYPSMGWSPPNVNGALKRSLVGGSVLTALGVTLDLLTGSPYGAAVVFVGIIVVSLGLVVGDGTRRPSVTRYVAAAMLLGVYIVFIFGGYGRLTVISLILAIAMLFAARLRTRLVKLCAVLGAPLVVVVITEIRSARLARMYNYRGSTGLEPPDSYVSPLETFARLTSPSVDFDFALGQTFVSSMTLFVPRAIWPEKPLGFGAELTLLLEPQLAPVGHSMAALSYGEWFYNYGLLGLPIGVVVIGYLVRLIDLFAARAFSGIAAGAGSLVAPIVAVLAISGIADYVWVGSFTYMARTGIRVAIVLAFAAVFLGVWRASPRRAPNVRH